MKIIKGDITTIKKGVIVHQVNCRNRIGAGLSGKLIAAYPVIESYYHYAFDHESARNLFGTYQAIPVTDDLTVINSFTQFYYGNAMKNGRVYTDMDKLVAVLSHICERYHDVYIPKGIGCGLAGGNWDELISRIEHLPLTVVAYE